MRSRRAFETEGRGRYSRNFATGYSRIPRMFASSKVALSTFRYAQFLELYLAYLINQEGKIDH